jgi:hypothetical protein
MRRNPRRIWLFKDQHDLLAHDKKFYLAAAMGAALAEGKRAMSPKPQRKKKKNATNGVAPLRRRQRRKSRANPYPWRHLHKVTSLDEKFTFQVTRWSLVMRWRTCQHI